MLVAQATAVLVVQHIEYHICSKLCIKKTDYACKSSKFNEFYTINIDRACISWYYMHRLLRLNPVTNHSV